MVEETNLNTYLLISSNIFGIYLFDVKKSLYIYKQEIKIDNKTSNIDLNILSSFLEDNVFKIEKLIKKFLKNICLIVQTEENNEIKICVKKKNYEEMINKNFLEILLTDAKDLFKESYQNEKIVHMIVNKYFVDDKSYSSYNNNFKGNNFCIEVQFNYISLNFVKDLSKILENYQIKINKFLDRNYMNFYFKNNSLELCEMAYKIENGCNGNEVKLVPKNTKKLGFFEKFFQLFS